MYEFFDHTADLGLRVRAATLPALFADAARGLSRMMVENLDEVRPAQEVAFDIPGTDRVYLLFDWLNEILYRFDADQLVLTEFDVAVTDAGLTARARGEPLDPGRHRLSNEVKAITYHQLHVTQAADGWEAEVIVDI